MGAPKQKWTAEEEYALKAGIRKHGAGKWRTIIKDPEFSSILCLRSNVDLKDKWRNMNVVMNGWGSREKARIAWKNSRQTSKHDDNPMALSTGVAVFSDDIVDTKPLAMSSEALETTAPKRSRATLEDLILEAITKLKEPTGSNKIEIALYIEDQYVAPPDFKRLLSAKLKRMTETGRLIKANHKYRITPRSAFSDGRSSRGLLVEGGRQREHSIVERVDIKRISKSQVDAYLAQMRCMSSQEADAAAAQAVKDAEVAMSEAEEATREAEAAEADAEAKKAFAQAASLTLKNRTAAMTWAGFST